MLYLDRYFWSASDPIYVAEGFFSMANVITFIKGTYLLSLDQNLGPLQLSLGLMAKVFVNYYVVCPQLCFIKCHDMGLARLRRLPVSGDGAEQFRV